MGRVMSIQSPVITRPGRISQCKLMSLSEISNDKGSLTIVEELEHVPFKIKRIFYLYGIPKNALRGGHAHKSLHQFAIAAAGSFDMTVDDGRERKTFHLDRPDHGLYIPPMIWDELENFSQGSLCLVLASDHYDEADYIRDYETFKTGHTYNES
jgi:dTDP-4-dehydrorhamnose 3,5-epimerase-like enzyme